MRSTALFVVVILAIGLPSETLAGDRAKEIIQRGESKLRGMSSQALMTMTVKRADYRRDLKLRSWTSGNAFALVEILDPVKEEGVSSLRKRDQMWNYLPKVDQVVRVPTSLMLQSWMGSDFTNDDLMKSSSLVRDYTHRVAKTDKKARTVLVECTPKPNAAVVWGKVFYWARQRDSLPVKQAYYDDAGVLVRTVWFSKFRKMDDRVIPTVVTIRQANNPHEYTTVKYQKVLYDRALTDDLFNRDRLRTNAQIGKALSRGWVTRPMYRTSSAVTGRRFARR